jgi:hypothetical protein
VPLRRLFPGAVFIHLLRDVREVARSLVQFRPIGGPRFTWQEAYEAWLDNVKACVAAEQAYGSAVVLRVSSRRSRRKPGKSRPSVLDVSQGRRTFLSALDQLETNVNSAHAPAGKQVPTSDEIIPEVQEEAEYLSDRLLSEEFPSYGPAADKQADLESAYDARVPFLEQFFSNLAPDQPAHSPDFPHV